MNILARIKPIVEHIKRLPIDSQIDALNAIRTELHAISPMKHEPVDCVLWVACDEVIANDYNPNSVAPPEMELLTVSIDSDGYTQPVVTMETENGYEVVDGFHRTRIAKECTDIMERIFSRIPVAVINKDREARGDRIAATIRHNRARGKHRIEGMSEIVVELKRRNWSDKKIGRELGMEPDEVLRLTQITGLAEMFADVDFTEAWEAIEEADDITDESIDG